MNRRDFLKTSGLLAAGAAGVGAWLLGEGRADAYFGEGPAEASTVLLPEEIRAKNILEIHLFGGVSQYESFYAVTDYGKSDATQWYTYYSSGELEKSLDACGISGELLQAFGPDANGKVVNFGPFTMALRARPDVLARTRLNVVAHQAQPHEVAIPLALGGRPLGHPALAGLGSHIDRYFIEREPDRKAPFSYVLLPGSDVQAELTRAALATGLHPGTVRPLGLRIDAADTLIKLLARDGVGAHRKQYDALMQGLVDQYSQRLHWKAGAEIARAPRLSDLDFAVASVANVDALESLLDPSLLTAVPGSACGQSVPLDATTMNLKLAVHLLTHPTTPARYVCVIDGGLVPVANAAGGYDSHDANCPTQSRNLGNTLASLMSLINAPGEADPAKLDLDDTLVILNTEFGRTPDAQGNLGRGHWPFGFPVLFIGGPIRKEQAGVYGACGADARATKSVTPTEHRVAALAALGIWPFATESFNVSDVVGAPHEIDGLKSVQKRLLGWS